MSRLRSAVASLALLLGLLVMSAMALETRMLFPAPQLPVQQLALRALTQGATELQLTADDGTRLYGWRQAAGAGPLSDHLVVMFSGNGASVGFQEHRTPHFLALGMATLHVNYRGYPGSEGSPSERGLRMDARAAWAEALRTHPAERVVVFGKSLGGGVALGLVAGLPHDQRPRALVLESTFTSAAQVGQEALPWLPVRLLMRNRFDSLKLAPTLHAPTLVLHGDRDEIIGVHHGQTLAGAIPGARYVELQGASHNQDLLARPRALAALYALLGVNTEAEP